MNIKLHKILQIVKAIFIFIVANFVISFIIGIAYYFTDNEAISYLIGYIISVIILIIIYKDNLLEDLKNIKTDYKGKIVKLMLISILFYNLMYGSNILLYTISGNLSNNENTARELFQSSKIVMFFAIGILGPIFEELTVRYPYRNIQVNNKVKLAVYTLLFASMHIINVSNIIDLLFIIPYIFLSLAISYSYYKTNNIYGSIIMHIINNCITLLLISLV